MFEAIKNFVGKNDMHVKLISANVAVFLFVKIVQVFLYLFNIESFDIDNFLNYLAVPATFTKLLYRFWTPITYMFLHQEFWHILGNMLWLFFLGKIFLMFIDRKKMFGVYILGGLSGAILYILAFNIFPVFDEVKYYSMALGASASVTAIVIAICAFQPNYIILPFNLFQLKIKWLIPIFVLTDIVSIPNGNAGGHIAHLGGAIFGFLFAINLVNGKDITRFFNKFIDNIIPFFNRNKKPVMKVTYNVKKQTINPDIYTKPKSDLEYNRAKVNEQTEMDRILDKISKSGYESLTQTEKDFLNKFSDKD